MDNSLLREQLAQYECFDTPQVWSEYEGEAGSFMPGWTRREWFLREVANLGPEAMPSPPLPPGLDLDLTRSTKSPR